MEQLRESQRLPLRCTECARRRVRCDKRVPCNACIARHCAHLCTREVVRMRGNPAVAPSIRFNNDTSLVQENSSLRERIVELEVELTMNLRGRVGFRPGYPGTIRTAFVNSSRINTSEEVGTILDDWNMGLLEEGQSADTQAESAMNFHPEVLPLLPCRSASTRIVRFSLKVLGWIHCALREDQFLTQHDTFFKQLDAGNMEVLQNHLWLAVYLSILTVGMLFMDEDEAKSIRLPVTEGAVTLSICRRWYRAVFQELELADAFGRPRLQVVQVTAILTLCNMHFGEKYRDINLLGLAINTARALHMDHLGSEASFPKSLERTPEWCSRSGRELGRRLWWTLVICDWLLGLRYHSLIEPDSFTCTLTSSSYDCSIISEGCTIADGDMVFSPLFHHIEMAKLARCVYDYLRCCSKSVTSLCQFLKQLDGLEQDFLVKINRLSISFSDSNSYGYIEPVWVSGQRSHYLCAMDLLRLKFCRILLEPNLSQLPAWLEIRTQAVTAASRIVQMERPPSVYRMTWTYWSALIAASVFLSIDLLQTVEDTTSKHTQIRSVELCTAALASYGHRSIICRESPKIIRQLLDLGRLQSACPLQQADVMQTIVRIARSCSAERGMRATKIQHVPTSSNEFSEGREASLSNVIAGASPHAGIGNKDFDWIMDAIMTQDNTESQNY